MWISHRKVNLPSTFSFVRNQKGIGVFQSVPLRYNRPGWGPKRPEMTKSFFSLEKTKICLYHSVAREKSLACTRFASSRWMASADWLGRRSRGIAHVMLLATRGLFDGRSFIRKNRKLCFSQHDPILYPVSKQILKRRFVHFQAAKKSIHWFGPQAFRRLNEEQNCQSIKSLN